jgi:hypothetical protein
MSAHLAAHLSTAAFVAALFTGCQVGSSPGTQPAATPSAGSASAAIAASAPPALTEHPTLVALGRLDALDSRKPVSLIPMMAHHQKQNMREHLLAVQEIVTGLAVDDFAAAEKAAVRIASSEQMAQMCTHMGAGAPGFTDQALAFHKTADGVLAAAKAKDKRAALQALGATLATCTACHDAWKQEIVDEATWQAKTQQAPPEHGGHH